MAHDDPRDESLSTDEATVALPNLTGERHGHIRIARLIGRGGMGEVYEGYDEALERTVAVKAIRPEHQLSAATKARFLREARLLSALDHPNICRIHDYIDGEATDLLVLEWLAGKTLRERMATGLDDRERFAIALDVAAALEAAHEKGIIHRDLKPENVMVLADGRAKVLDFGIARSVTPLEPREREAESSSTLRLETAMTEKGAVAGTVRYMSPEQARGETLTVATDLFSLGLVLQEMWTGTPAYHADEPMRLLRAVLQGETQPMPEADRDVAQLVSDLQSLDPADRPTAAECRRRLAEIRDRPLRRRRRLQGLAASLLVVALLVAASWAGMRLAGDRPLITADQRGRVLLLPLANETGSESNDWVERGLWAMVVQTLEDTPGIEAVSPEGVDRLLDQGGDVDLASLERSRLIELARSVGAELALRPVMRADGDRLVLTTTSVNLNGSTDSLRIEGSEPTEVARELGARLVRRLRPGTEFRDVFDTFSHDPFVNRLHAEGLQELRTDGAKDACPYFEVALDVEPGFRWGMLGLANCLLDQAEFAPAMELVEQVLADAQREGDRSLELDALGLLSAAEYSRGELERAEQFARRAHQLSRELGDREGEASLLARLGDLERQAGRLGEARSYYEAAYELRREIGDPFSQAHSLHTLGVIAEEQGRSDEAEDLLLQALELERDAGLLSLEGMTHNSLGILYTHQGRFDEASPQFEAAMASYERVGARQQMVHTLSNYAVLLQNSGDLEGALERLDRAMELSREIDSKISVALVAFNRAFLGLHVGRLEQAEQDLDTAAAWYGAEDPDVLLVRAMLLAQRGEIEAALEAVFRSRELGGLWGPEQEAFVASLEARR